jgi:hypothetical protein
LVVEPIHALPHQSVRCPLTLAEIRDATGTPKRLHPSSTPEMDTPPRLAHPRI